MTPDILALLWREGADEENVPLRTWLRSCCPHKSVSLYILSIDRDKKVRFFSTEKYHSKRNPEVGEGEL